MNDLTTPNGVATHMAAATSGDDWNTRVDEVMKANGGEYPNFWIVISSGIYTATKQTWTD